MKVLSDRRAPRPLIPWTVEWRRVPAPVRYAAIILALVAAWQAYLRLAHVSPLLVASPADVGRALAAGIRDRRVPDATASTLLVLVTGIVIGGVSGFAFASVAVFSAFGRDVLSVLIAVMNPLPSIAILPLAMIWFGLTPKAIVLVVALATIWPVAINADAGFRAISPTTHMVARNLGLRGPRMILGVLLPAALPYILAGVRAAWAFGWRTVVAAELVFGVAGSTGGLGWYINNARYYLLVPDIFAGLIVISILGIAVDMVFGFVEHVTIVRWGMRTVH